MWSSKETKGEAALAKRLLLLLAERLGPGLDRVDPSYSGGVRVRDLVLELEDGEGASSAAVRFALVQLIRQGFLAQIDDEEGDPDLMHASKRVVLRLAGLMQARRFKKDVGRPVNRWELVLGGRLAPFGARIVTEDREQERKLNARGSMLAVLYALAVLQPREEHPSSLGELAEVCECLAVHGIRARSGPTRASSLGFTADTVSKALARLVALLPGLEHVDDSDDGRRSKWFVRGPWPNIIVRSRNREIADWPTLVSRLQQAVGETREQQRRLVRNRAEGRAAAAGT